MRLSSQERHDVLKIVNILKRHVEVNPALLDAFLADYITNLIATNYTFLSSFDSAFNDMLDDIKQIEKQYE